MLKKLQQYRMKLEDLRGILLFEEPEDLPARWQDKLNPMAAQHFLTAIAHMELAGIELRKAEISQRETP